MLGIHKAVAAALCFSVAHAFAQGAKPAPIGDVELVRGAGLAQRGSAAPRVLGAGPSSDQGEVLPTAANSLAGVKVNAGVGMTLRPNASMKVDDFGLAQAGKSDSLSMKLLKGG